MARFSLAPPVKGNGDLKSIDIVGFPDIEVIKKFAEGNIGVASETFNNFFEKASAGLQGETSEIFSKLSNNNNLGGWGLQGIERVVIKSIFETQKPYMEVALAVLDSLVVVEDIIAVLLAGDELQSLKPKTNDKSLYTKLNGLKGDIDNVKKEISPSYNSFSNISDEDKLNGISIDKLNSAYENKPVDISESSGNDNFDWATVSVFYSTGTFIPEVPYKYIYRDIVEKDVSPTIEPTEIPEILDEDNDPVIIFDIWVDRYGDGKNISRITDLSLLPKDWDLGDKWNGVWDNWSNDKNQFKIEYIQYITGLLKDEFQGKNIDEDVKKEVQEIVLNSIPFDDPNIDLYEEMKKSSFHQKIFKELKLSNDSKSARELSNTLRKSNFGYKPKKINGKWVFPEADYNLQLVKVQPSKDVRSNNVISGNKPLVYNYDGEVLEDILTKSDFNQTNYSYVEEDKSNSFLKRRYRKDKTGESVSYPDSIYGRTPDIYFRDKGVFYIIEGVYKNRKDVKENTNNLNQNSSTSGKSEKWYRYGTPDYRKGLSIAAASAKFAKFGATVLPNLITTATTALETLNNPFNLIFEILMEKMSDGLDAFGSDFSNDFSKLQRLQSIKEKRDFINNSDLLKKFVSIDLEGKYKFIFDGAGVLPLFGNNFGIGIKNFLPNLILEKNGLQSLGCDEKPPDRGKDISGDYKKANDPLQNQNGFGNNQDENKGRGTNNATSQNVRQLNDSDYEIVNIEYSTGDFVNGVNYKYYYITLDNQALINKAEGNLEKAKKIKDPAENVRLKLLAMEDLQKAQAKDPSNIFINEKIQELQKEDGVQLNMMIQFLINLVVLPIKIVICIIDYILDFFKSIILIDLPLKIPEFLGFDWILEFFKPTKVLELMGIKFNPDFPPLWQAQSKIFPSTYKFDASQILDAPFLGKLPLYNTQQFPSVVIGGSKILLTMGGLFIFLEGLVNNILCFLFNIFNIDKIFICPSISLTKFVDQGLKKEDIDKLLEEADFNFLNNNDPNNRYNNSQVNQEVFVYDVELNDGTIVKNLNYTELQAFVASNRNLKYKYNFDR
jgi:hypothetical protein